MQKFRIPALVEIRLTVSRNVPENTYLTAIYPTGSAPYFSICADLYHDIACLCWSLSAGDRTWTQSGPSVESPAFCRPHMLPFTIPAAMLLTVSLVYGRLTGDQEVIAAKAAGVHPFALMFPALFIGGVLSAGTLVLSDQMIPWSMTKIEQHAVAMLEDVFIERLRTELQFSDSGSGLHVNVAAVDGRRLIYPVFRYAKAGRVITMQAEEAELNLDLEQQEVVIELYNGFIELIRE